MKPVTIFKIEGPEILHAFESCAIPLFMIFLHRAEFSNVCIIFTAHTKLCFQTSIFFPICTLCNPNTLPKGYLSL